MDFWSRVMAGVTAFRQAYMASGQDSDEYVSLAARRFRYELFWALYENTAFSNVHNWAAGLKMQEHLYKYARHIYNPSYRIGEFHKAHTFGGQLNLADPTKGAIPISTPNEMLLGPLVQIWTDSNMMVLKDVISLRGAIEGDVFLEVIDDPRRGKVRINRLAPDTVVDVTFDLAGNVKGYVIEEKRKDPDGSAQVVYRLECVREGNGVVYRTFKNNAPYAWGGQPSLWAEPYGFVPVVHIQHNDVGLDFGWSELYPERPKFQEVDEQASLLNDYMRKYHDPVWAISGSKMPNISFNDSDDDGRGTTTAQSAGYEDQPGRNRIRTLTGFDKDFRATPLVAPMQIDAALKNVAMHQEELERDYPELQMDIWSTGATSGRALRTARQRVEDKVQQRRANYDNGMVRIQQMAVAIGGFRNYDGYAGFGLDSFDAGALDHMVADRPVFKPDPMDQGEVDLQEWQIVDAAVKAGASLEGILRKRGWSEEDITQITGDGRV